MISTSFLIRDQRHTSTLFLVQQNVFLYRLYFLSCFLTLLFVFFQEECHPRILLGRTQSPGGIRYSLSRSKPSHSGILWNYYAGILFDYYLHNPDAITVFAIHLGNYDVCSFCLIASTITRNPLNPFFLR